MRQACVTGLFFSRHDYPERLDQFIAQAKFRLDVVSSSFRLSSPEGDLLLEIRNRLSIKAFQATISLLAPDSAAAAFYAHQAGLDRKAIEMDLNYSAWKLLELRASLTTEQQARFQLLQHDCLPFGTAYMLDASSDHGVIHVETRMHGAPKKESFGYRVEGPSDFYRRNYESWMSVITSSRPLTLSNREQGGAAE